MLVYPHTRFLFWLERSQDGWYQIRTKVSNGMEAYVHTATVQLPRGKERELNNKKVPVQDTAMTAFQIRPDLHRHGLVLRTDHTTRRLIIGADRHGFDTRCKQYTAHPSLLGCMKAACVCVCGKGERCVCAHTPKPEMRRTCIYSHTTHSHTHTHIHIFYLIQKEKQSDKL